MASRIQIAERWIQAFNDRRYAPNDLKDFVSENVVVAVPAVGQEFQGYQGAAEFNGGWAQAFSDSKIVGIRSTDRGEYVETLFRGQGTFDGPFATPQGVATGDGSHKVDVPFTNRVWIEGDKITHVELDFNPGELMTQMGLA